MNFLIRKFTFIRISVISLILGSAACSSPLKYAWLDDYSEYETISRRIPVPEGYVRAKVDAGSFADWLRHLPLKLPGSPVLLFDGSLKADQSVHVAVVDIDVGARDLQQCADAVIRLRAEYLWSVDKANKISFNFTSGDACSYKKWKKGWRPLVRGNEVVWVSSGEKDASYAGFRDYLDKVFQYAGTASLSRELKPVTDGDISVGDVFIQGGHPGHAVIVVDLALNPQTGKLVILLAQSYMPAQDIHILINPNNAGLSPWYDADFGEWLITPEWDFKRQDLKRFP